MIIKTPILLIGGYGLGNFGDDILMLSNLSVINKVFKKEEITVLGHSKKDYCEKLFPGPMYIENNRNLNISSTIIIYGGGTQFYNFPGVKISLLSPQRIQRIFRGILTGYLPIRKLVPYINKNSLTFAQGCKFIAVCLGLGPFHTIESVHHAKETLSKCDYISVRDEKAMRYCNEWNIKHAKLRADFGYAMELWAYKSEVTRISPNRSNHIGFIPRDWRHSKEGMKSIDSMISAAKFCRKKGHKVIFFLFSKYSDTECRKKIHKNNFPLITWNPFKDNIDEFVSQLSQCKIIISSRAHGAIVSAVLGIPCICVEIEPKLKIISEMLGSGTALWAYPFNENEFHYYLNNILNDIQSKSEEIQHNIIAKKQLALDGAKELEDYLYFISSVALKVK